MNFLGNIISSDGGFLSLQNSYQISVFQRDLEKKWVNKE
jgi:hypothetical protein